MSATFLDSEELSTLTGRRVRRLQIETLRRMGLPFWVNAAGRPVVPRSAIDGKQEHRTPTKRAWTPPD